VTGGRTEIGGRSANSIHGSPIDFHPLAPASGQFPNLSFTCTRDSSSRTFVAHNLPIVSEPIIRGFHRESEYSQTSGAALLGACREIDGRGWPNGPLALFLVSDIINFGCAGLAGAANPSGQPQQTPQELRPHFGVTSSINFDRSRLAAPFPVDYHIQYGGSNRSLRRRVLRSGIHSDECTLPMTSVRANSPQSIYYSRQRPQG